VVERRRHNRRGLIGYLILSAAIVAALTATWFNDRNLDNNRVERIAQINQINTAPCKSLRNLYIVIRKSIEDGNRAIDEISYYKAHPAERLRAHARNRETLELFRIPPCPKDVRLKE